VPTSIDGVENTSPVDASEPRMPARRQSKKPYSVAGDPPVKRSFDALTNS